MCYPSKSLGAVVYSPYPPPEYFTKPIPVKTVDIVASMIAACRKLPRSPHVNLGKSRLGDPLKS